MVLGEVENTLAGFLDDVEKGVAKKIYFPALIAWQKKHKYPFRFFTEASINLVDDDDLLNKMRDAGFNEVFVGIETPEKTALKDIGKNRIWPRTCPRPFVKFNPADWK